MMNHKEMKGNLDVKFKDGVVRTISSLKKGDICNNSNCSSESKVVSVMTMRSKVSEYYNGGPFNDYEVIDCYGMNQSLCSNCFNKRLDLAKQDYDQAQLDAVNVKVAQLHENLPYRTEGGKYYDYKTSIPVSKDKEKFEALLNQAINDMKVYTAWCGCSVLVIKNVSEYVPVLEPQPRLRLECILTNKVEA